MKRLVLLALMLAAGFALAEDPGWKQYDIAVSAGGSVYTTVDHGNHFRIRTDDSGITARVFYAVRGSSGSILSYQPVPALPGSGSYPAAADTVFTIFPTSTDSWNTFNSTEIDSLHLHNSSGASITVYVQTRL